MIILFGNINIHTNNEEEYKNQIPKYFGFKDKKNASYYLIK